MDLLFDHIAKKSPRGIPYSEAVQLMLLLYVTLDVLPEELRRLPLTRQRLAKVFSQLTVSKLVLFDPADTSCDGGPTHSDPARQEHWEDLAERLMRGKITLQDSFYERASEYV
jgi:hypothetical protein